MLDVVKAPLDVRFHHEVGRPKRARERQCIHGVQGSDVGPISVATAPEVRLVDGCEDSRDRALPPLVFHGRYPERAALAVAFRDRAPLDACASVALPLESLDEVPNVLLEMVLVRLGADVIDAIRRILPDVLLTRSERGLIEPLVEVANAMLRLLAGLLRSPRQAA